MLEELCKRTNLPG